MDKRSGFQSITFGLLLITLLSAGLFVRADRIGGRDLPSGDEGSWMQVAANAANGQGFVSRVKEHFYKGNDAVLHPEDCRHPFFTTFLAILFKIFGLTFKSALFGMVALGLVQALTVALLVRSIAGMRASVIAAAFVLFSPFHLMLSTSVYAEMLFALWFVVLWWIAIRSGTLTAEKRIIILGLCIGIGWLIRPNALMFLPAGIIEAFILGTTLRKRAVLALLFVAAAGVAASPWLIRNGLVFHNPFYSWYGAAPWVKTFSEGYTLGSAVPTFANYLHSHSIISMIIRPFAGFWKLLHWVAFNDSNFIFALLPFAGFYVLTSGSLALLLKRHAFIITGALASIALASWIAPVADSSRFVFFLVPAIGIVNALGIVRLGETVAPRWRTALVTMIAVLVLLPLIETYRFYFRSSTPADHSLASDITQVRNWLSANTPKDAVVISHTFSQLAFQDKRLYSEIPCSPSDSALVRYLRDYKIGYMVIGPGDRGWGGWTERFWSFTKDGVAEREVPEWLERTLVAGRYRVYRVVGN